MTTPPNTLPEPATADNDARGVRIVALIAAHLYAAVALLQIAAALGAPFGGFLWGGSADGVLPAGLRIASAAAAGILIWMTVVVLARADVVRARPVKPAHLAGFTWPIAGFMVLNTLGNVASQSLVEQRVFAPVTAVLAALTVVVAHRGHDGER